MPTTAHIKPNHKAIQRYLAALAEYRQQKVKHEGALETAFQRLLEEIARSHHCALIPKHKLKIGDRTIFPDGTVFEKTMGDLGLRLGFWEAKDLDDDLDQAIAAKIAKKYPLNNTIFENTKRAVLYQAGKPRDEFDLADKKQLASLLNEFFAYREPEIENFHDAVEEFKDQVPDLAKSLVGKIKDAHEKNKKFQAAFESFFELCQQTLNPNISREAVDEMLVQHLLTERLFRTIFQDSDFVRRNVIAAEIEKVIDALTSLTFSRESYLKTLDRFYRAIEDAARTLDDFAEKQHFLNTVYERFFQGYSVKLADTHGIVYTPQEIVDFMCASVEEVLKTEFGLTLGSKGVNILDPCTGTGNFIVNLINRIPKKDLPRVYKGQLFANEVMLLPYYIAALNIEHAYFERTGTYEPFEGLCFVDTLDMTEDEYVALFAAENTARIKRQKKAPITVVIGNPPYNVGQINNNDNNKNRKYSAVDRRIKNTYAKDSAATSVSKLNDPYVKFFRWAVDRLQGRDGIVCYVSNNSFVEQIAFDGMRKHLLSDFTRIYHVHLEGNVRVNPRLAGSTYNVFGIQIGVGITVAVRVNRDEGRTVYFERVDKELRKEEKLRWLASQKSVAGANWQVLEPDASNSWLVPKDADKFAEYLAIGSKATRALDTGDAHAIFKDYSLGIATHRDSAVIDYDSNQLASRVKALVEAYNGEVDRYKRSGRGKNPDEFVKYDGIIWDRDLKNDLKRGRYAAFSAERMRTMLYRPFTKKWLFFDRVLNAEVYGFPHIVPVPTAQSENRFIAVSQIGYRAKQFSCLVGNQLADLHLCASLDGHQCFPFYIYDEDGSNRRENITDWALEQFRTHYGNSGRASGRNPDVQLPEVAVKPRRADASTLANEREISKWDIFHYVYGLLHHPGYRTKFADNLKRELPRIPFAPALPSDGRESGGRGSRRAVKPQETCPPSGSAGASPSHPTVAEDASGFWAFADAGKELARLHLDYEALEPWPLAFTETEDVPLSYAVVDKMRLSGDKTKLHVNPSLTLAGIPREVFDYRLGNRSALEWVIDQYQVSVDKRSGIRSDPNRADDPEYIVRLLGQVVRVSAETVKIVNALPAEFA